MGFIGKQWLFENPRLDLQQISKSSRRLGFFTATTLGLIGDS